MTNIKINQILSNPSEDKEDNTKGVKEDSE